MRGVSRHPSITFKLSVFLVAAMALQCILFVCFILFGGTMAQLDQNAMDILNQQTITRKNYLENDMVQRWSAMDRDQALVALDVSAFLEENGLRHADLNPANPKTIALLGKLSDTLIDMLRRNMVTGVFLAFNGADPIHPPEGEAKYSKAGLYYRDMDPDSTPSNNSDVLVERCSSDMIRALGFTMDIAWAPTFSISADDDAYFAPIMAALEYPGTSANDLGYWSAPHVLDGDTVPVITYSQPLLDAGGKPYGVLGVELSLDYLRRQLPYGELGNDADNAYLLAVTTDERNGGLVFQSVVTSGSTARWVFGERDQYRFQEESVYSGIYQVSPDSSQVDARIYGSVQYLNLYNNNTPFEHERWTLIGLAPTAGLLAFSHSMVISLILLSLVILAAGILVSLLVGSVFTRPIRALAQEVRGLDPNQPVRLAAVNIQEIDELSTSIERLSRDVAEASSRLSKILGMTQMSLAAFQFSPQMPTAYYTDDFFPLIGRPAPKRPLTPAEFIEVLESLDPCREEEPGDGGAGVIYKLPILDDTSFCWLRLRTVQVNGAVLGVMMDVTQEILEKRRIEYERDYDLLTHLLNRRAFQARLSRLAGEPDRLKTGAMLMMDLDNLKYLNDTYGHDCGDEYIRCAADVLRKFNIYGGLSARMSGDEFYLFFSGYGSREELQTVLDRLQQEMASASIRLPDGQIYRLRASVGVAWYPEDSTSLPELVRFADFAMYEAKNAIKGGVKNFDIQSYHQNSFLLYSREELNRILDEKAVDYVFQPIVSCATGTVLGFEALMRPRSKALPSPLDLLRLARAQSKLPQMERLTWFQAMRAFVQLSGPSEDSLVFLNSISSLALPPEDFAEFDRLFAPYLNRIVVELTESEESDSASTRYKQERCRQHRMQLALDDFGTGYSNDSVLLDLQPDFIKVDISIVRGIDRDPNRQTLLGNLASLCHGMGIRVIAEGVETAEEMYTVVTLGADCLQGFYLSKPAPQPLPVPEPVLRELSAAWRERQGGGPTT